MKYLFKNSFFTFLKSKVAMILLAFLIFLSTATFTLLSSTSNAFKKSFNQVAVQGKLHDFTIKEKYSANGDFKLNIESVNFNSSSNKTEVEIGLEKATGDFTSINKSLIKKLANEIFGHEKIIISGKITKEKLSSNIAPDDPFAEKKNSFISNLDTLQETIRNYYVSNQSKIFQEILSQNYQNELFFQKVNSIVVSHNQNLYKIVDRSDKNSNVNSMVLFDGNNILPPLKPSQMIQKVENQLKLTLNKEPIKNATIVDKGFVSVAYYKSGSSFVPPKQFLYIDPSSLMAIISPSFKDENNISLISPQSVEKIYEEAVKNAYKTNGSQDVKQELKLLIDNNYSKFVIWVDATPYFIVGSGTTPDFSFPIINPSNPIPNIKNQAILFVNKNGYKRIEDAFRGNERENYLAFKFREGVLNNRKKTIINEIEKLASQKMSWGNNVDHIVSETFDTSETIIMAPHRIFTLKNLQNVLSAITYLTISMLILFVAFVVVLVIKKQIKNNRKTLGILLANGYSKKQIGLTNTSISLIIASFSSILGYISGFVLQFGFIAMFKNYWTLPISNHQFDILSLCLTVFLPMFGIALLSFFITIWELRGSISEILNDVSFFSKNVINKIIAPLKWLTIKTRISLSLFFTNFSKMILIFISATITIITISTALSLSNKFTIAKTNSKEAVRYEFKLDLASPTTQGGLMKMMPIEEMGVKKQAWQADNIFHSNVTSDKLFADSSNIPYSHSKFMIPNLNDAQNSHKISYLENLIQFKSLLNFFIGFGSIGVNPWNLANKQMPENQLNQANKQNSNFINFASQLDKNKNNSEIINELIKIQYLGYKPNKNLYFIKDANKISVINLFGRFTENYKNLQKFIFNGLKEVIKIYNDPATPNAQKLVNMPFLISYRNIISNKDDETFTRLEGDIFLKNIMNNYEKTKLEIIGLKKHSPFIKISNDSWKNLLNFKNKKFLPVIANKFFIEKYQKSIGDVFEYTINNHKDRFQSNWVPKKILVKIVGTQNSYASSKLYTLQDQASQQLGWNLNNELEKNIFNGIFTKHKNSILFKTISLYSLSGLYPGIANISSDKNNAIRKNIDSYLKEKPEEFQGTNINGVEDFITKFTSSPYVNVYKNVNWQYTDEYRFNSLVDISTKLIYIVEFIAISLAIMFIIIISSMMISSNKKFISTMKVMGYKTSEINRIFFLSFLPSIIIGFLVAAPFAFGIALALKIAIISFGAILIPISLTWWTLLVATSFTLMIIGIVYWLTSKELKNISLVQAFAQ